MRCASVLVLLTASTFAGAINTDSALTEGAGQITVRGRLRYRDQEAAVEQYLGEHKPSLSSPLYSQIDPPSARVSLAQLLRRPQVGIEDLRGALPSGLGSTLRRADWKAIETGFKYVGYLAQQRRQIARLAKAEARGIPEQFEYRGLPGLSNEVVEKMERVRPRTLGQAGRIPGVTPAAISILDMHLGA